MFVSFHGGITEMGWVTLTLQLEATWPGAKQSALHLLAPPGESWCYLSRETLTSLTLGLFFCKMAWITLNFQGCQETGRRSEVLSILLSWLGWLHFIKWDHGLCKPWSIMQDYSIPLCPGNPGGPAYLALIMWRKARRRENITDFEGLFCLWPFTSIVSLLLLYGIGPLIPFHRRGRWLSERLSESLRANQLDVSPGLPASKARLTVRCQAEDVTRRQNESTHWKHFKMTKHEREAGPRFSASFVFLCLSWCLQVSCLRPKPTLPRAPSRPSFPLYLSLHLPPLISNFQACELLQKA